MTAVHAAAYRNFMFISCRPPLAIIHTMPPNHLASVNPFLGKGAHHRDQVSASYSAHFVSLNQFRNISGINFGNELCLDLKTT